MEKRYEKNIGFIRKDQQENLLSKTVAVIGCGGNGEYVLEYLARLGLKELIFFDGDTFDESNINRQLYTTENNLGENKATESLKRLKAINDSIKYTCHPHFFSKEDIPLIAKCDIIIYCADASHEIKELRLALRSAIVDYHIPIIDACLTDCGGLVSIINEQGIGLFDEATENWIQPCNINPDISQPAYLCALIAAYTVSECEKYFAQERYPAINQTIDVNIITNEIHRIDQTYGILS